MKRKKSGGGGANWMDTYGDMVTLLLCFFVLLYSMSTVNEEKWIALVKSFNPNAVVTPTETSGGNGPNADIDIPGEERDKLEEEQASIDAALDALYEALKEYAQQSGMADQIALTKGDGYVFISFDDTVFFAGDSYVLLPDGREVLGAISAILSQAAPYIDEVRIMGHTAQVNDTQSNNVTVDRFLSSNRATIATVFIQENSSVDPARLVSMGYGQWRPVDTNATADGRSHNRRVEILITGLNVYNELGDSISQYKSMRSGEGRAVEASAGAGNAATSGQ